MGRQVEPFYGAHQSGVATALQAHTLFVAFDLSPGVGRGDLVRLMRLWTDAAARLTQGVPALADSEPELAEVPARLTATIGYGPGVFAIPGLERSRPAWLAPLPAFPIDRLEDRWSGGDLLLQLGSDDPVTLAHTRRMMVKDAGAFTTVRWTQSGFHRAAGSTPSGTTGRNMMGQVDGTENPAPGTSDFARVVWASDGPAWLRGGTGMVLRRIRMDLDGWDKLGRGEREQVMGRRLANGAPLTGANESDKPDFAAVSASGLPVIPEFAHIRLAHGETPESRFLRRPFNYDDGFLPDGSPDVGLLFTAYAADLSRQFVPIQRKLADSDVLNTWTTPVGSAVFAVPPGCRRGSYVGESLLG